VLYCFEELCPSVYMGNSSGQNCLFHHLSIGAFIKLNLSDL
jgi:hypothetical protein